MSELYHNSGGYRYGSNLNFLKISFNFINYRGCCIPLPLFYYCHYKVRTFWAWNSKVSRHIWFDNWSAFPKFQVGCLQFNRVMILLRSCKYTWSRHLMNSSPNQWFPVRADYSECANTFTLKSFAPYKLR